MENLTLFNNLQLHNILKKRSWETKFGEKVQLVNDQDIYEMLKRKDLRFVIFGIAESTGVVANLGKTGTEKAWAATLESLVNIQSNNFTTPEKVLILGCLEFPELKKKLEHLNVAKKKDLQKIRKLVESIDVAVTHLVQQIVSAGKIPIIIGGGHNNAYGNIKGTALALKTPINAINFDAHSDFRPEEGRHSGNGFSYAYAEGFLKNYFVFGLHENYTSDKLFKTFKKVKRVAFNTFEDLTIRKQLRFKKEIKRASEHITNAYYGIEIDCDAIADISSSAQTPSGFSVNKVRQIVTQFGSHQNAIYLHICEAAPNKKNKGQIGKLITYLITDFIKAKNRN